MNAHHEASLAAPLPPIPDQAEQRVAQYQQEQLQMQQSVAGEHSKRALGYAEKGNDAVHAAGIIFGYYKARPPKVVIEKVAEATHDIDDLLGVYRQRLIQNTNGNEEYVAKRDAIFGRFGLKPEEVKEITSSWGSGYNAKKMSQNTAKGHEILDDYLGNIRQHLLQMVRIEAYSPGAVRGLFQEYGIRHFARYYDSQLLKQHKGEHTGPTEVVLHAAGDHNLAFGPKTSYGAESAAARDLGIKEPLFVEAADPVEAFSRLSIIKKKFGEIKRAEFVAHGAKKFIDMGRGILTREQVRREKNFRKLIEEGVLAPDADIIFSACFSQKLAQAVSEQTQGKTIAPGRETSGVYLDAETGEYAHQPIKGRNYSVHVYERGKRSNSRIRRLGRHAVDSFRRPSPSL